MQDFSMKKKLPFDFKNPNTECIFEISRDKASSMKKMPVHTLTMRQDKGGLNCLNAHLFLFYVLFPQATVSLVFSFLSVILWLVLSVCAFNMSWANFL